MKKHPSQKALLKVYKRKTDGSFMVVSEYYKLTSYGNTKKEAIQNIRQQITDLMTPDDNTPPFDVQKTD